MCVRVHVCVCMCVRVCTWINMFVGYQHLNMHIQYFLSTIIIIFIHVYMYKVYNKMFILLCMG